MINITNENKELCFADSTPKPLYLYMLYWVEDNDYINGGYWKYFSVIKDAIILESAEIDEGFLDGNKFQLGSFVIPSMQVQWEYKGIKYEKFACIPVQQIGEGDNAQYIAYFNGFVAEESVSEDGSIITAKIVPTIYNTIDLKITDIVENVSGFANSTFGYLLNTFTNTSLTGIFIDDEKLLNRFLNANRVITDLSNFPQNMTVGELLKQAGEFLGAHIKFKGKRLFDISELDGPILEIYDEVEFVRISELNAVAFNEISPLPEEYIRVEYIQSTGTQYIDTAYRGGNNTKIEIKQAFLYTETNSNKYSAIGTVGNNTDRIEIGYNPPVNAFWSNCGSSTDRYNNEVSPNTNAHTFVWSGDGYFAIDGIVSHEHGSVNQTFTSSSNICLFKDNERFDNWCPIKTYYCRIWEYESLQRDFVPCIRKSDNVAGLYDLVYGDFYENVGSGDFLYSSTIENYTLPYYINLITDKTKKINFSSISLSVESGEILHYTKLLKPFSNSHSNLEYNIKGNFFYEKLSEDNRWKTLEEVGSYLDLLNFYKAELQGIYPIFIESGDYLICKSNLSNSIPKEYTLLDYIELNGNYINTKIYPLIVNAEFSIDFELLDIGNESSVIFLVDGTNIFQNKVELYFDGNSNSLVGNLGYYGGSIQLRSFEISPIFKNQKISFNLKINGNHFEYGDMFNGEGDIWSGDIGGIDSPIYLGRWDSKYRIYHFSYTQDGITQFDMYPCKRKDDGILGMYDFVSQEFVEFDENPPTNFGFADVIIPPLYVNANGINSIRANIDCKATEI